MKKNTNKTPKLRFPQFTDDWEQRKLGDVYSFQYGEFNNNPDNGGKYPIYGANGVIGGYTNFNAEDSVVIGHMGAYAGYVIWAEGKHFVTYNGTIAKPSNDSINSKFGYYALIQKQIYRICAGSGQPFVSYADLNGIDVKFPKNICEQKKIGKYFTNLDNLITLHQRKLDTIKELKKGMLQKMFPKKGEKVPEVRFPGFTDDWEQRKVSEIGNIVTGSTPKTSVVDNYGGEFLFVSPADIQGNRYVDETITTLTKKGFEQGRKIRERASLFVSIGSTIGKVAQTSQESTTNQQINAVEPYDNFDDDFVFTSLENVSGSIKAIASSQAVPIVNKTTFGETAIEVPSALAEQQKIGAYFRNLDHLITLHQQKLDVYKELKKGLLQQMFV